MKSFSKSNERKIGAVLSYASIALSAVIGILYTPVMLRLMGQTEYGLYGTVSSFVSLLCLMDAGFSSSYIKFYSKYKNEGREDKIKSFNSLFFTVFAILSLIVLACGLFFSLNLNLVFDKGLSSDEYIKAEIMMLLLTGNTALNFITTVFNCYISANEEFTFLKAYGLINTVVNVLINLIVLYFGYGALGMVIVSIILNVINRIIYIWYAFKRLNLGFDFNNIEKGLFKQVFAFSGLIAVNMIVDKINVGIDSVLLGRFCGTAVVAVYSVGSSLNNHFTTFSTAISGVFVPYVHDLVNSNEMDSLQQRKALTDFFVKVGRIQYIILALICSGFIFFGKPFIYFWAGEGYDDAYAVALLLIVPSIIPLSQNVGIEIQRAENRHHYRSVIYGLMAIVNLVISIFLCQIYGAIGSAIGTFLANIIANIIIMNIVYNKKININIIDYWKAILRQTAGLIPAFAVGALIMKFAKIESIMTMFIFIVIYAAVFCLSAWLFSLNEYERGFFKSIIIRFKRWK